MQRSYKQLKEKLNNYNCSLSIHLSFPASNGMHVHVFFIMLQYFAIQIKVLTSLCFINTLKSGLLFIHITHTHASASSLNGAVCSQQQPMENSLCKLNTGHLCNRILTLYNHVASIIMCYNHYL